MFSDFNDAFGLFLNGENIAILPDGLTEVTINNVNHFNNTQYFNGNDASEPTVGMQYIEIEADGFTNKLVAKGKPKAGWNKIKIVVADIADELLDSYVLLEAGSFTCRPKTASPSREPSQIPSASPSSHISASPSVSTEPSAEVSETPSVSGKPSREPSVGPTISSLPSHLPSQNNQSLSTKPSLSLIPSHMPSTSRSISSTPSSSPVLSNQHSTEPTASQPQPTKRPDVTYEPTTMKYSPSQSPSISTRPSELDGTSLAVSISLTKIQPCKTLAESFSSFSLLTAFSQFKCV